MAGMLSRPCARFLLVGELVFLRGKAGTRPQKTTDWRFLRVGYKRVGLLRCLTLWSGREDSISWVEEVVAVVLRFCLPAFHGMAGRPPPPTHTLGSLAAQGRAMPSSRLRTRRAPEVGCQSPVACWRLLAQPGGLHVELRVASSGMCGGSTGRGLSCILARVCCLE